MSHLYKLVKNTNEKMTEAFGKWYARPVYTGTLDLNGIAELIQRNSTAKKSDALAVLTEMVEVISDALKASQRVKIDGFGTFKIGMSSKGADDVKKFNIAENLRGVRVLFQPVEDVDSATKKRTKRLVKNMSFAPVAALVNAGEIEERGKDGSETPEP